MMRALASAITKACQTTLDRLAKGDFKSADEAFAAYQTEQQLASKTLPGIESPRRPEVNILPRDVQPERLYSEQFTTPLMVS